LMDLHVHLSQYRIKGNYRAALLPWLNEFVFPEEQRSVEHDYSAALADEFFRALYKSGTTTAVIYTAPYLSACETAFEAAQLHNFRAFIGMTLMNQNCPEKMMQSTDALRKDCETLVSEYHKPAEGLQFILTPRFAPTCSDELMKWVGSFARENGLWIQTHLSENPDEIKWVKELFKTDSYTQVYEKFGTLTDRTILAHCIHLSGIELDLIKDKGCKIAHCPDSNFFLRSGEFPLEEIRKRDIPFALGSDVGAGTTLNMLYHSKMYNYRQSVTPVTPAEAFYRATLGAAKVLHLDNKIGTLQNGKDADLVLLKLPDSTKPITDEILSLLVFTGHEWQIEQVYAKGVRQA